MQCWVQGLERNSAAQELRAVEVLPNASLCAKQPEMLEFGAEKGLLQGRARRMGGPCPQALNSPEGFSKAFLKAR